MGVGKSVRGAVYVHRSALHLLDGSKQVAVFRAQALYDGDWNVARIEAHRIGLLLYRDFDRDPFPALARSWVLAEGSDVPAEIDYSHRINPPILHRKELLVADDYPLRAEWAKLTSSLVAASAFVDAHRIGTRRQWASRLDILGLHVEGWP